MTKLVVHSLTASSRRRRGLGIKSAFHIAGLGIALLAAGCVVVPRTELVYDPECRNYAKQMTLEVEVIGHIGGCHGDGCIALLVSAGVISAASAVVSGSVAIIGNIAYWIERRGQCPR